jgi:hypothetical protein
MLTTDGHWFVDEYGRRVLLRGVNLGGSTKVPAIPDGRTHIPTDFSDHRTVSFVGHPFPLSEAEVHFRRLRHWGFNCLRLLTTWEAIEHAGPGAYDEEYLDYFAEIVRLAGEYDFYVFIDPHQDVWSRMTGGDGAPGWTLETVGFDIANLEASEAAYTQQHRGSEYGTMVWPSNGGRLGSATMFTLFFGGERFAPNFTIEGKNIQHYLQRHFINAIAQIATRVKNMPHVLGYDSLNEPSRGYLGTQDLNAPPSQPFAAVPRLTPIETMLLGAGHSITAPLMAWQGLQVIEGESVQLNPNGVSAWTTPERDVWRAHGVWDMSADDTPTLLQPDYFADFELFQDGVRPFAQKYIETLRAIHPDTHLFVESEPNASEALHWENARADRLVHAGHWYDVLTLLTKRYDPTHALVWGGEGIVSGAEAVKESFAAQLGSIKAQTEKDLEGVPTLIGEFGTPFDLNGGKDFRTEKFEDQASALSAYYDALDANLLHSTQWNYTADNTNEHGDGWNGEDLSIFSLSQQWNPYDLDNGGRGLEGFCRPTVRVASGTPTYQRFNQKSGDFTLRVDVAPGDHPTEIYVPRLQYQEGYQVEVSSGMVEHDTKRELIFWHGAETGEQTLTITRPPDDDEN